MKLPLHLLCSGRPPALLRTRVSKVVLPFSKLWSNLSQRSQHRFLFVPNMPKRTKVEELPEPTDEENEENGASKRPRRAASQSKPTLESAPDKESNAAGTDADGEKTVTVGGKDVKVKKMSAAEVKAKKSSVQTTLPFANVGAAAKSGAVAKSKIVQSGEGKIVKIGEVELQLPASWLNALGPELDKPYFQSLQDFLESEVKAKQTIFPPLDEAFNALKWCPLEQVKVVPPPSLNNMFKELEQDPSVSFTRPKPAHGSLEGWAKQGVLLLNAVLTVRQASPNSHKGKGWEKFTDAVIKAVNEQSEGVVFFLWGGDAKKRGEKLNGAKHKLLVGPHPSPLSAHKGFFGCRHFSLCNEYLKSKGKTPIDWQI